MSYGSVTSDLLNKVNIGANTDLTNILLVVKTPPVTVYTTSVSPLMTISLQINPLLPMNRYPELLISPSCSSLLEKTRGIQTGNPPHTQTDTPTVASHQGLLQHERLHFLCYSTNQCHVLRSFNGFTLCLFMNQCREKQDFHHRLKWEKKFRKMLALSQVSV